MHVSRLIPGLVLLMSTQGVYSQNNGMDLGQIHGNFQTDFQYYREDTLIGAPDVPEQFLLNGFMNVNYTRGNVRAGIRFESYENTLLGFDPRYKGTGIPYRYVSYSQDDWEITAGHFYEQFGSGLIFRAYEERGLGFDNVMDGLRVKFQPTKGVRLTGMIGQQRFYFTKGDGIVRGIDADWNLNESMDSLSTAKWRIILGGSFVSKYQEDQDPRYVLPLNVGCWAGRATISYGKWSLFTEAAYKINDPSTVNNYIYKDGSAVLVNLIYSQKGLGILLAAKRIDNMNYRSDRTATVNDLLINYLPAMTKQHIYRLPALYPYATQPNGEMGFQTEITYTFPRNSLLGGKYGTQVALNYSVAQSLDLQPINDTVEIYESATDGYKSDFFAWGDERYFQDFNIEITKKLNRKWKCIGTYIYEEYNKQVIEGKPGFVYMQAAILEAQYNLSRKHTLRFEAQGMWTRQDRGDWAMLLVEYSISPNWFLAIQDAYNYGNPDPDKQIHYYIFSMGYTRGGTRFLANYGRQQEGIFCVGGVCRNVPASNGLSVTITSTF